MQSYSSILCTTQFLHLPLQSIFTKEVHTYLNVSQSQMPLRKVNTRGKKSLHGISFKVKYKLFS